MKMKVLGFKLQAKPETPDTADLDIFDDIGEYEDWWTGELKGFGPKKLTDLLAECDATNLNVRINSNGGDVFEGLAIHNLLKSCGKNVTTTITGLAASSASIIAMAGSKVRMHDTSMMMIHNCWTIAQGNAAEFRKLADDMDAIMDTAKKAYLNRSGGKLTAEKLNALLEDESYLSAQQCLELGLCDEILDKEQEEPGPEEKPDEEEKDKPKDLGPTFRNEKKKCWFF